MPTGKPQNQYEAFITLILAAMHDAILERRLTQFQATIDPDGKGAKVVRIIVIPEEMDFTWPKYAPAGTPTKGN